MLNEDELKQDFILLGKQIRKLRKERNLTLNDLSLKTGIRIKYLQKIENGLVSGILINKHLLKIAIALEIKFFELFNLIIPFI